MSTANLNSRIEEAATILQPFLKDKKANAAEIIKTALLDIGVDDTELGMKILGAQSTTDNDFESALRMKGLDIPSPRIKIAWLMLKGQDPFAQKEVSLTPHDPSLIEAVVKQLEKQKPVGQWSDTELLQNYGKDCPPQVEEELAKRSKNRPCIIFNDDKGSINIDASMELLRQARHQVTPGTYLIAGKLYPVYKIGDFPMNVLFECPIHSNVLLVDGYCEECGMKWDDFDKNKDKYIFLRLVADTVKIEPVALRMYLTQSFEELTKLYPKVLLTYKALLEEEKLPTLKRRLSSAKDGDPFRVVHKSY